jgi:hypothetical protein
VPLDALGWLGDLIVSLGWAALIGDPGGGTTRADIHMLHNMFGKGEPLDVPPAWVQGAPDWQRAYSIELKLQISKAIREDAVPKATSGETSGEGHFAGKVHAYSKPSVSCMRSPLCPGADQFYGSGGADFRVEGNYRWQAPTASDDPDTFVIDVEVYDIFVEYEDRYAWNHVDDPSQHSRQQRGWYTPFQLHSEWDEPPQTWRADVIRGGPVRMTPQ